MKFTKKSREFNPLERAKLNTVAVNLFKSSVPQTSRRYLISKLLSPFMQHGIEIQRLYNIFVQQRQLFIAQVLGGVRESPIC